MLHTPNYDVRTRAFCGPTAISAVTGEPISVIREHARSWLGAKSDGTARAIMGMSNKTLLVIMARLGWFVVATAGSDNKDYSTRDVYRLDDFLELVQMGCHKGKFIINVTGHYYAVDDDEICDTHTQIPIEIHRFKRGHKRWIQRWWKFERDERVDAIKAGTHKEGPELLRQLFF